MTNFTTVRRLWYFLVRGHARQARPAIVVLLAVAAIGLTPGAASAAPGDLDRDFGLNGVVWSPEGVAHDLAVQDDGKLIAAGYVRQSGGGGFGVVRYTANGRLDSAFGKGGTVVFPDLGANFARARAVAVQPDRRIVVVGQGENWSSAVMVRLLANGSLDDSFGDGGRVITNFGGRGIAYMTDVAIDSEARIVASAVIRNVATLSYDFLVARYLPDGTLDPQFGIAGTAVTDIEGSSEDFGESLAVADDDSILLAGSMNGWLSQDDDFAVVKYTERGLLDVSFGVAGRVVTETGADDAAFDLELLKDGGFVLAGGPGELWPFSVISGGNARMVLARYTPSGSLDERFGEGGIVSEALPAPAGWATGVEELKDADGRARFVVASLGIGPWQSDTFVARYGTDGSLDGEFGTSGTSTVQAGYANDLEVQAGKLVVAGESNSRGFFLARLINDADKQTALSVTAPTHVQYGDEVLVGGVLTSGEQPMAGQWLTFSLANQAAYATTDGAGAASASLIAPDPGTHTAVVRFDGASRPMTAGGRYLPSSASAPVVVEREATVVAYTGNTSARGSVVELSAVLIEDDGPPVVGAELEFKIAAQSYRATTDASGRAVVTASVEGHGRSQDVVVRFAGTPYHSPSSTTATVRWGSR